MSLPGGEAVAARESIRYRGALFSAPPQYGQLARSATRSNGHSRRQRRQWIRFMRTSFLDGHVRAGLRRRASRLGSPYPTEFLYKPGRWRTWNPGRLPIAGRQRGPLRREYQSPTGLVSNRSPATSM